jgi:ABC-type multidrug transport system fused ATPase/permease subunit
LSLRLNIVVLNFVVVTLGVLVMIGLEYVLVYWALEERETFLGAAAATIIGFSMWNLGTFESARGRIAAALLGSVDLVGKWARLQDLFVGLERAFYPLELESEVVDPEEPEDFPERIRKIRWHKVHFPYDEQAPVLTGVDLQAEVDTKTAIVGRSGSGPDTFLTIDLDHGRTWG